MRSSVASIIVALLALAAPASTAHPERGGEAAESKDDDVEAEALAHIDRGVEAFRAGEYALAHREFTAANQLVPDRANPYRWLALTEVQLGDCAAALVHIEGFLSRVDRDDPRSAEMVRNRVLCEKTLADQAVQAERPPSPPRARRPITRRWWFWPAVIGAAAAITTGVVIAVDQPDDPVLPPVRCDDAGCL